MLGSAIFKTFENGRPRNMEQEHEFENKYMVEQNIYVYIFIKTYIQVYTYKNTCRINRINRIEPGESIEGFARRIFDACLGAPHTRSARRSGSSHRGARSLNTNVLLNTKIYLCYIYISVLYICTKYQLYIYIYT